MFFMQNFTGNRMVPLILSYGTGILLKTQYFDLTIRSVSFFVIFSTAELDFFKYVVIMKSVVKFQCDLCLKSSFYSFSA